MSDAGEVLDAEMTEERAADTRAVVHTSAIPVLAAVSIWAQTAEGIEVILID